MEKGEGKRGWEKREFRREKGIQEERRREGRGGKRKKERGQTGKGR